MRRCKWFSDFYLGLFFAGVHSACNPFPESPSGEAVQEFEYSDSSYLRESATAGPLLSGSMTLEVQEDARTQAKLRSAILVLHLPVAGNVLVPGVAGNLLQKGIYEPLPEEQPCGIPGFPPCPAGTRND